MNNRIIMPARILFLPGPGFRGSIKFPVAVGLVWRSILDKNRMTPFSLVRMNGFRQPVKVVS